MLLKVDPRDPLPLYEQIVRQIKFAIANGAARPGELIPSVRELARELTINPNTVARAYRELQSAGLIVPVRGTGLAVARGAEQRCQPEREKLIRARLRHVIAEARKSGIAADELRQLFERELAKLERRKVST